MSDVCIGSYILYILVIYILIYYIKKIWRGIPVVVNINMYPAPYLFLLMI